MSRENDCNCRSGRLNQLLHSYPDPMIVNVVAKTPFFVHFPHIIWQVQVKMNRYPLCTESQAPAMAVEVVTTAGSAGVYLVTNTAVPANFFSAAQTVVWVSLSAKVWVLVTRAAALLWCLALLSVRDKPLVRAKRPIEQIKSKVQYEKAKRLRYSQSATFFDY